MRKRKPRPICETCGEPFTPKSNLALSKARFCTSRCYGVWRANNPAILAHMAAIANKGAAASNSPEHRHKKVNTGAKNGAWKGGATYFRKHGNYKPIKYIRCPLEFVPMARKDGYVMEHRAIMARMTGYCLTRTEVVHHRDHNPQNNHPANLELWPDNRTHKLAEHGQIANGAACRWFPTV